MQIHPLDHLLALILVLLIPFAARWEYGRLLRALADEKTRARLNGYRGTISWQWGLATLTVALWLWRGRPTAELGLGWVEGRGAWIGGGVALLVSLFFVVQAVNVTRSPERLRTLEPQFEPLKALLPHDAREARWFSALSLTAGICEELLYRGFLIFYMASFVGTWPAVVLSSLAFGLGHLYQGPAGIVKTFGVGLVMAILYRMTGSLWAPMLVHATIDLTSGWMGRSFVALPPLPTETEAPPMPGEAS